MKEEKRFRKIITAMLELPTEIILNLPMITVVGRDELNLENYKGIVEYSEERIRIDTSCGIIRIEGRGLVLKQITSENLVVKGQIIKFEYL